MTTMISQPLATNGAWTQVAVGPIANILLVGPPGGWAIRIDTTAPTIEETGMPVTSVDGSWSSSVLDADESVFARPFGARQGVAMTLSGMFN